MLPRFLGAGLRPTTMTRRLVVASLRRLLAPRRADALDAATRTLGVHVVGHVAVSNEPPSCVCGQVGLIGKPFLRSFIADYNEFMQQSSPAAAAAATRTGDEIDAMIGLGEKIRTAAAAINADRAKCRCGGEQRPRPFLVDDGMRRIRSRLDRLHGLKTAIGSGGGSAAAAGSKYEIKERGPRLAAPPAGGSSSVDTDRGQRATVG